METNQKEFAQELGALADILTDMSAVLTDRCEAIEQETCCAVITRASARYRASAEKLERTT